MENTRWIFENCCMLVDLQIIYGPPPLFYCRFKFGTRKSAMTVTIFRSRQLALFHMGIFLPAPGIIEISNSPFFVEDHDFGGVIREFDPKYCFSHSVYLINFILFSLEIFPSLERLVFLSHHWRLQYLQSLIKKIIFFLFSTEVYFWRYIVGGNRSFFIHTVWVLYIYIAVSTKEIWKLPPIINVY